MANWAPWHEDVAKSWPIDAIVRVEAITSGRSSRNSYEKRGKCFRATREHVDFRHVLE